MARFIHPNLLNEYGNKYILTFPNENVRKIKASKLYKHKNK